MVLAGKINKEIVGWIAALGGRAVGISGKDAESGARRKGRAAPSPIPIRGSSAMSIWASSASR